MLQFNLDRNMKTKKSDTNYSNDRFEKLWSLPTLAAVATNAKSLVPGAELACILSSYFHLFSDQSNWALSTPETQIQPYN